MIRKLKKLKRKAKLKLSKGKLTPEIIDEIFYDIELNLKNSLPTMICPSAMEPEK